ncbi:hypothetical protein U1Q18_038734 [Sarracenia purpurea var. burkii]
MGRWRRWLGLLIKGVGSKRLSRLWQWLDVGGGQMRWRTSAGDGLEEEPDHRDWWFGPEKQRIRMLRKIPVGGETMRPTEREAGGSAFVNDRRRGVCDRRHYRRSNLVSGSSLEELARLKNGGQRQSQKKKRKTPFATVVDGVGCLKRKKNISVDQKVLALIP